MTCKFCNAEIQDELEICPVCGKNLTEEETPTEAVAEEIVAEEAAEEEIVAVETAAEAPVEEPVAEENV